MTVKLQAGDFYGATARTLSLVGFRFTEKAYAQESSLPRHSHELAHFCLVLAGSYTEKLGRTSEMRTPTTLVFYPPDVSHAETHHSSGRHFLIELEPWREDSVRDYGVPMTDPSSFAGSPANWMVTKLYREFRNRDEFSNLAIEGFALELLAETLRRRSIRPEPQPPKWLDNARQILHATFSNPPSLDDMAKTVGVHPVHLARVFRKFQHCTTGEYIRQLRVEHARQRMLSTRESLVEIALSSGFADQTHFSKSFKRVTGMTPSAFRRLIRRR